MSKNTSPWKVADFESVNKTIGVFPSSTTRCPSWSRGWDLCACVVCVHTCVCIFVVMQIHVCVCLSVCVWLHVSFYVRVSLVCPYGTCVPLCITNSNPQQTGTKILALRAVWLTLFMPRHCELSPQPYRLCAVTVKFFQKHAPCHAMLCCGLPSPCHCYIWLSACHCQVCTIPLTHKDDSSYNNFCETLQVVCKMTNCYVASWENNNN